jgi:hypothetical protein
MQASSTAPPRSGLVGQVSPLRCGTRVVTQLSHRSVCPAHQNLVGVGVSVRLSECSLAGCGQGPLCWLADVFRIASSESPAGMYSPATHFCHNSIVCWPAGMYSDREREMQLPSVPLIQRKSTALTNVQY